MVLNESQTHVVERFRRWMEQQLAGDARFGGVSRMDRSDGSTLATRWQVGGQVWLEIAVRPLLPQVRVGIVTDDRWMSEDFETKIEESGDTMSEFVGMGMHEAGLDWDEPPVEHYRGDLKYFYFATPLDLQSLDDLDLDATRRRVLAMFNGYYAAFGPHLK